MFKPFFSIPTPPQSHDLIDREPWLNNDDPTNHIGDIFLHVKSRFRYERDEPGQDIWGNGRYENKTLGKGQVLVGDCDDFSIEILKQLKLHGAKSKEIALVICKTTKGQSHMVAAFHSKTETHIFDNTKSKVAPATDPQFEGYKWEYMSKNNKWFSIILNR
ncbi:transglutaminase-like cysteine peptidase [uncultured Kiloniella sp.]|uniref:transglutaminase-like cysteine peptidase n=1 Tax=uncultured Kiloniella sp. TaxID=1133091 RepID=UPI002629FCDE|nr:transglutaminase-like cysteine peptidase [uncultured Kiloniella sp.]